MLNKFLQASLVDDVCKTAFIKCIVNFASDVQQFVSKIDQDLQEVISFAENEVNKVSDAEITANKICTILEGIQENINNSRCEFLNAYHLWLEQVKDNEIKPDTCSKNVIKKKKNCTNNQLNGIIEVEESSDSSDPEIVNEIKYLKSIRGTFIDKKNESSDEDENVKHYRFDPKLHKEVVVILERLSQQKIDKYIQNSSQSDSSITDTNFLRLINLNNLEKERKRKYYTSDSSETTNSNSSILTKSSRNKKNFKKRKADSSENDVSSYYASSDNHSDRNNNDGDNLSINSFNNDELNYEERLKQQLLNSDNSSESSENDEDSDFQFNKKKRKPRVIESSSNSSNENENQNSKWLNDKLLKFKVPISEDKQILNTDEESEDVKDYKGNEPINKTKKKKKCIFIQSDGSTTTTSDNEFYSDDSMICSSSEDCQIVNKESEPNNDAQLSETPTSSSKPTGRKNIRKVLDDQEIAECTKQAGKDEENRLQRLASRKQLLQNSVEQKQDAGVLELDIDVETKKVLLSVDRGLVKFLKPHQESGIKFMWDSCFETLQQAKLTEGSGCILAHCMGLGKTFQIVTLVHTLLSNENTGVNTVMVACPMNTLLNWSDEFSMWLKHVQNKSTIRIFEFSGSTKIEARLKQLQIWHTFGGVLIISYDMFRNFTSQQKKLSPLQIKNINTYLIHPGADLVVCDEGHLLKNENSVLAHKMQNLRTKRRIILTGTPLQNNLNEYHCMVQFVKPDLLGTKKEFLNRFNNPITNGQFDNSTAKDVKLMKHRAHVLHRMLEGCVQRRDYAVLTPFLPPKQEYVILIRLSELQINMYRYFIETIANTKSHSNLFQNYHEIKRLIAHPKTIQLKAQGKKPKKHSDLETMRNPVRENASNILNGDKNLIMDHWWDGLVNNENLEDMYVSYKLILLFGILERCEKEEDKLLVFSTCLYTLDVIEAFLIKIDKETTLNHRNQNCLTFHGKWKNGLDYFRLDGNVGSSKRHYFCQSFNDPKNKRARLFLISTKAGGLGINLIGANRVIIFDPSWNPSNDLQSIFRVFRFGQKKPCYVYRFLSAGTMEQKIYNRQVTKLSLSLRVLDEQQIVRHYRDTELSELYKFESLTNDVPVLNLPRDHVLADVFLKFKDYVYNFFEHDSLLQNQEEEELDEEERKQAWLDYQQEKRVQQSNDLLNKSKGKASQKKRVPDNNGIIDDIQNSPVNSNIENPEIATTAGEAIGLDI